MGLHNPQPLWVAFLVLCAPPIALGAFVLARKSTRDEALSVALAPALACATWLLGVHIVALCTRSFTVGLPVGTLIAAGAGGTLAFLERRRGRPILPSRSAWPSPWCWITTAIVTLAMLPATLGWSFHDELFHAGHMAIASQIENGHYPPHHGVFGAMLLRYHYGFNLLCAMLSSVLRLHADRAIDIATIGGWAYTWILLWALGDKVGGPKRGAWTATATLLGGGLALAFPGLLALRLIGLADVGEVALNPPLASYFFQHPFTLGMPVGLGVLAVFLAREAGDSRWATAALFLLVITLSLAQIVMFVTFLGAMLGTEVLVGRGRLLVRSAKALGFVAVSVLAARALGGFFTPQPGGGDMIKFNGPGLTGHVGSNLLWNVVTFGLLLPLGVAGLWLLWRRRRDAAVLLALLVAGGSFTINFLKYAHSWDIFKFGTIVALGLGIAAGTAIARVYEWRPKSLGIVSGVVITALVATPGIGFLAVFAFDLKGLPYHFWKGTARVAAPQRATIAWLRHHAGPGDVVYTSVGDAGAYAQWGGLPQAQTDAVTGAYGFAREMVVRRRALLRDRPSNPDHYLAQGIRWFVIAAGADPRVDELLRTWQQHGRAQLATRSANLSVFYLHVDSTTAGPAPRSAH